MNYKYTINFPNIAFISNEKNGCIPKIKPIINTEIYLLSAYSGNLLDKIIYNKLHWN